MLAMALTMMFGIVLSAILIHEKSETAFQLVNQQLWGESVASTTQLPTWRVTGTLNPVVGGVEQVVGVPPMSSPIAPSPSPAGATETNPSKPAQNQAPAQNAAPTIPWVPPPKPWEPLGQILVSIFLLIL